MNTVVPFAGRRWGAVRARPSRRRFIRGLAGLALGATVLPAPIGCGRGTPAARQPASVPRIGYLSAWWYGTPDVWDQEFLKGLRDLGYVEDQNITIEWRFGGRIGQQPSVDAMVSVAAELAALNPRLIVAPGTMVAIAARRTTSAMPIVFTGVGDPVGAGLVASLARPGGNATGLSSITRELTGKRLALLKEAFPATARVAVFEGADGPVQVAETEEVRRAAEALGLRLVTFRLGTVAETVAALDTAYRERVDALLGLFLDGFIPGSGGIFSFAQGYRLPLMTDITGLGLMSYAPSEPELYSRAAAYVDKILRGARPADLPVERPPRVKLVINLRTAEALGFTLPPSILAQADEVIPVLGP